jgi:catechol 2,3-dioxygenase-like lactoylglutathione lyase family enzyme
MLAVDAAGIWPRNSHSEFTVSIHRLKSPSEFAVKKIIVGLVLCLLYCCVSVTAPEAGPGALKENTHTRLGNFSVSLAVKNLQASREFYEKLGFHAVGGDAAKHFLILQNETSTIGLFQGMFEKNILTFNPGWDRHTKTLPDFDDVRDIQRTLKSRGLKPLSAADESTTGPASLMLLDPDGNPILVDQHVPSPRK